MSNKINHLRSAALLASLFLLAACSQAAPQTPTIDPNAVITEAAATVAAQLTQNAVLTPTQGPTNPPLPTMTSQPSSASTSLPTLPPAAAATSTTAPAVAPTAGQDAGAFVTDVTIPDGTGAAPGATFVKTWRVKNTGKTTWDTTYSLNWIDGDKMGAPEKILVPKDVRPGDEVDISVTMTAPAKPGTYQTYFRFRNAAGQFFRLDGTGDLWIKILVGGVTPTPDLTETLLAPTPTPVTPTASPTK